MSKDSDIEEILEKMVIRPIRRKDFDQLFDLVSRSFGKEIQIAGLDLQRLRRVARLYLLIEWTLPLFEIFCIDFETILVAVSGKEVVGEVHLVPQGKKIWTINSIAVDSRFRKCGIGSRLTKEALGYVSERNGKRVLLHVWADNFAALKMYRKFNFDVFESEILLLCELLGKPTIDIEIDDDVLIREVKPDDISHIRKIFEAVDRKKMQEIASEILPDSFFRHIMSRIVWSCSKKWVLEMRGEVLGYTHVNYVPPQQAGTIESFCVIEFLTLRNVKRVTTSLNEEWKDTIEMFKRFGFKPTASVYQMIKEPV